MTDRQLDTYNLNSEFLSMPKYIPGRNCSSNFLYFKWCNELAQLVDKYTVVIQAASVSGAIWRGISKLREAVELPQVQLGQGVMVALLPEHSNLPVFVAELIRGSLYIIPETNGVNGRYQMDREGMLRPN